MKAIARRLCLLEVQFGPADGKPPLVLAVCPAGWTMAITDDKCIEILGECGFRPAGPLVLLHYGVIPFGLSATETEAFVREHAADICGTALTCAAL